MKTYNLTVDDGFKILNHILKAFEKNQLNTDTYRFRVRYLLENFQDVEREIEDFSDMALECPFCGKTLKINSNSCINCGLHVRYVDFENYAILKNLKFGDLVKGLVKSKMPSFLRR